MVIREYQPEDINALTQYLVELQNFERQYDPRLADGITSVNALFKHLMKNCETQCGKIFIAEENNTAIGFVAVQAKVKSEEIHDEPYLYAYVSDLFVSDGWRGKRVGEMLLAEAEAFAKSQNSKTLKIDVLAENLNALNLYKKIKFEEHFISLEKKLA
ncbi:MAG: GNAT family N-acetyltransferase [Desulfobacterales bacterium]|nr:GNAT family N-acetyltransferase [Desulfobacterales bacterium]